MATHSSILARSEERRVGKECRSRWLCGKESACNAGATGDAGSIPGLERSPGGGHSNPLQYSCLEIPWTEEPGGLQSMGSQSLLLMTATPPMT